MKIVLAIFVQLLVIAALVWWLIHRLIKRIPDRIRISEWAKKSDLEVLSAQRRWMLTGPFFWLYRGAVVYRIRVRDRLGIEKAGWLCVEAPFYFADCQVRWSER